MKTLLLLFACIASTLSTHAQLPKFEWAKSMGGDSSDLAQESCIDKDGSVYTTGSFSAQTDFDPGPGAFMLTAASGFVYSRPDVFVSKLDAKGNFQWAVSLGDTSDETGKSITVDDKGNTYILGQSYGDTYKDYDPGPGTSISTPGMFMLKLDAAGHFVWAKVIGQTQGNTIRVDASGNLFIVGSFNSSVDFDPGPGEYRMTTSDYKSVAFILKLDTAGNFVWVKNFRNVLNVNIQPKLVMDQRSNLYIYGVLTGTGDFDPGPGECRLSSASIQADSFICKLDSSGKFIFAHSFGSSTRDQVGSVAVDKEGYIYLAGDYGSVVDFDPGPGTATLSTGNLWMPFILKLDKDGNFVWVKSIEESTKATKAPYGQGLLIGLDQRDGLYYVGYGAGMLDYDPGPKATDMDLHGYFLLKLDTAGSFRWVMPLRLDCTSLVPDPKGPIFLSGHFLPPADFDEGKDTCFMKPVGQWDIVVEKLSQPGALLIESLQHNADSKLYPNPGQGVFVVEVPATVTGFTVEVYNSLGALICTKTAAGNSLNVSIAEQAPGLYFVKIKSGNTMYAIQKVLKE